MAAAISGFDFAGLQVGYRARREYSNWSVILDFIGPLKIFHHEFPTHKRTISGLVVNGTHYKFAAGWFQPAGNFYWKTVITRVGQFLGNTHSYGIFSPPVKTKVACTPNEVIVFDIPPVGETWIISDCEDDYNYIKVSRDTEACLRACYGDAAAFWDRLCITDFATTPEEVAAWEPCTPGNYTFSGCVDGGHRGNDQSVWACPP